MRLSQMISLGACLLFAQPAAADEAILEALPGASVVGRGILSYAFWDVYKATLYAPKGRWSPAQPFALSIEYYRAIDGDDIADRSVQEMRKQGFNDEVKLAAWNAQMKDIFPDVKDGLILSAVYLPGKQTAFYSGGTVIGSIKGDEFGKMFFGIWLDEKTSEPDLRRALLGMS